MLYEWKRTIDASVGKDFQEALKKIELVHMLEVEEGTMFYNTMEYLIFAFKDQGYGTP